MRTYRLLSCLVVMPWLGSTSCGDDHEMCTVDESPDGGVTVSCPDGSRASIQHGDDGLPGSSGPSGPTGADGPAGVPGSDGDDGLDGVPCSVEDNGDGTTTMQCPDGSSETWWSGFSGRVFYTADISGTKTYELYMTEFEGGIPAVTRINGDLARGSVYGFSVSEPGDRVVYLAEQDTEGRRELYLVNLHSGLPSAPTKLNHASSDRVQDISMDAAGQRVVYRDCQGERCSLYGVNLKGATPGSSVKLTGTLVAGGGVRAADRLSADGNTLVYHADAELVGKHEIYWVDLSGDVPAAPVKINAPLPSDEADVQNAQLSEDGNAVVFSADQETLDDVRLYAVDLSGVAPSLPIDVSGELVAGGFFKTFSLSAAGDCLVYLADQETNDTMELFYVDLSAAIPMPVKLNGSLPPNVDVADFRLAKDGGGVMFSEVSNGSDGTVFRYVDLSGVSPSTPVQINRPLAGDAHERGMALSEDGSAAVYVAAQGEADRYEVFWVDVSTGAPGPDVKLNWTLPDGAGSRNTRFAISADGRTVAYSTDQSVAYREELNLVSIMPNHQPTAPLKVSPPIVDAKAIGIGGFVLR